MNPEITQFDIILSNSKLLQQLKKNKKQNPSENTDMF